MKKYRKKLILLAIVSVLATNIVVCASTSSKRFNVTSNLICTLYINIQPVSGDSFISGSCAVDGSDSTYLTGTKLGGTIKKKETTGSWETIVGTYFSTTKKSISTNAYHNSDYNYAKSALLEYGIENDSVTGSY